jgi:putative DNA primase/helicase
MSIIATNVPAELIALLQWIVWRYETRSHDPGAKPTKVPYQVRGYRAATDNPRHWSRFADAVETWQHQLIPCDGIAFVFTPEDPYCGIDLDNIWPSDADEGADWGWEILDRFTDTYSAAGPSDRSAKIWCKANALRCGSWKVRNGSIEIYDRGRYFAVTGQSNGVGVITDHQDDVDSLIRYLDYSHYGRVRPVADDRIDGKIPYGTQHNTLVSLAGTMRRRGMTAEAIEAALLVVNEQQCERPGPVENITKIAHSAARWLR